MVARTHDIDEKPCVPLFALRCPSLVLNTILNSIHVRGCVLHNKAAFHPYGVYIQHDQSVSVPLPPPRETSSEVSNYKADKHISNPGARSFGYAMPNATNTKTEHKQTSTPDRNTCKEQKRKEEQNKSKICSPGLAAMDEPSHGKIAADSNKSLSSSHEELNISTDTTWLRRRSFAHPDQASMP